MSYLSEVQAAAAEAERVLANITGGESCVICGQTVNCTVAAPNAFQQEALGREMTEHGYRDAAVMVFTATRQQFATEPRNAGGTYIVRPSDPTGKYLVHSVHFEDPLHFTFVVVTGGRRLP